MHWSGGLAASGRAPHGYFCAGAPRSFSPRLLHRHHRHRAPGPTWRAHKPPPGSARPSPASPPPAAASTPPRSHQQVSLGVGGQRGVGGGWRGVAHACAGRAHAARSPLAAGGGGDDSHRARAQGAGGHALCGAPSPPRCDACLIFLESDPPAAVAGGRAGRVGWGSGARTHPRTRTHACSPESQSGAPSRRGLLAATPTRPISSWVVVLCPRLILERLAHSPRPAPLHHPSAALPPPSPPPHTHTRRPTPPLPPSPPPCLLPAAGVQVPARSHPCLVERRSSTHAGTLSHGRALCNPLAQSPSLSHSAGGLLHVARCRGRGGRGHEPHAARPPPAHASPSARHGAWRVGCPLLPHAPPNTLSLAPVSSAWPKPACAALSAQGVGGGRGHNLPRARCCRPPTRRAWLQAIILGALHAGACQRQMWEGCHLRRRTLLHHRHALPPPPSLRRRRPGLRLPLPPRAPPRHHRNLCLHRLVHREWRAAGRCKKVGSRSCCPAPHARPPSSLPVCACRPPPNPRGSLLSLGASKYTVLTFAGAS